MLYKKTNPNRFAYGGKAHEPTAQEYINTVQRRLDELTTTRWCIDTIDEIAGKLQSREINHIRCLAIGSPQDTQNAQFQLAFLVLLSRKLAITSVSVWDPLFERFDPEIFRNWGIEIKESMDHSEHIFYYVPHGPRSLNVHLASQSSLMYLGNDFKSYVPHTEIDPQQREILTQFGNYHVQSYPVSKHDRIFLAMNNLALHVI